MALSRPDCGDGMEGDELPRDPEAVLALLEDEELDEEALGMEREDEELEDALGIEGELELELDEELELLELDGVDGMELCDDDCWLVDSQAASASDAMLMTSSFLIGDFFMVIHPGSASSTGNA